MKSQIVRLLDVFVVGPWMIRGGIKGRDDILTMLGLLTIIYNGINYLNYKAPANVAPGPEVAE
jgi:hypothetical protein